MSAAPPVLRFGAFELAPGPGELRAGGNLVKLAPQPFRVLALLAARSGEIVTREEIRDRIWNGDTFVDFEQGLNFCIRQIREALGDTAASPQFIETLPRRGYRFLLPVDAAVSPGPNALTRLIVLPFRMLRPDPESDFLAFSLPDAVTTSLADLKSLVVRSSLMASRFAGDVSDLSTIASAADVDVIVTGTLLCAANEVRVTTQLTDAASGSLLSSFSTQTSMGDVFSVQDDLTSRIVAALSVPLTAGEQRMLKRDVPSDPKAYEYFLRGNKASYDSKQWAVARDLYLRCVDADPGYAPAWARLGRIHHVMGKYLDTGTRELLDRAEAAFRKALDLNPDLAIAHKFYAQLEVDLGRAHDAMTRLVARTDSSDPEVFAGLVSPCRYCGLLDASVAAHERAVALDPKVRTSVPHTWFMQADHERVATIKVEEYPYIVPLTLAALGRGREVLPALRALEDKNKTRLRDFIVAARTLLEDDRTESLAAVRRIVASPFGDPEGLFYLTRHLAHLGETSEALQLLGRVVGGGFFCYPILVKDPWLDSLRKKPQFTKLLAQAEERHREAVAAFTKLGGARISGSHAET